MDEQQQHEMESSNNNNDNNNHHHQTCDQFCLTQQQQHNNNLTRTNPNTWTNSDDGKTTSARMASSIDDVGLLYYSREPIKLKDFSSEVRAPMDVEQFAHQAELLLELDAVNMGDIVGAMLAKAFEKEHLGSEMRDEACASIFVSGSSVLMAHTIQGVLLDECQPGEQIGSKLSFANYKHDQSWLCALCSLAQLSHRHIVIARLKRPTDMGENAHHVRLFVLVLVPTVEKCTKDSLETGRTFATMLTDGQFRQRLLSAQSDTQFRALMVNRAQQLACKERLKNRHKYMLDAALQESLASSKIETCVQSKTANGNNSGGKLSRFPSDTWTRASSARPLVFCKNPRTSKLFELITSSSADINQLRELNAAALANERCVISESEKQKLAELEAAAKQLARRARFANIRDGLEFGRSAWDDFTRRLRYYPSDYRDAFIGPPRTVQKTVATIWFLYFGILLPTIAFSSLNIAQTHGQMGDLRKSLFGQAIGGLGFALLGGQPLVIIMTTAPLCLYTKVIHQMCIDFGFSFPAMYAAVGLWNGLFLVLYSMFGFSRLMKWCTRSTEEIFAMFIVVAFITDAGKDMMHNFRKYYYTPACEAQNNLTLIGAEKIAPTLTWDEKQMPIIQNFTQSHIQQLQIEASACRRETSLLFVLLMLGTLWLSITLYKFRRTQYLSAAKRDLLADYALPTAVVLMSLLGVTVFGDVYVEAFPPSADIQFERAPVELLPVSGILTSLALGFTLSLLFFMDQNISAAMVNTPQNRLKKGDAFHYDLLIIGLLNGCLTLFGLPMMHGVLPHSPLHARSLADIEEQVEEGHLHEVVIHGRETRVTGIVAHILLFGSLLLIPYPIAYIPRAVLNGLFLYMAITPLDGLQIFERIMLLFTEQSKYPPNHYIRRCPQRKIHQFTFLQLVQLLVMCFFGFSPINIVEMFFPVIILLMIPFRHKIVSKYIKDKYLDALDGKHS